MQRCGNLGGVPRDGSNDVDVPHDLAAPTHGSRDFRLNHIRVAPNGGDQAGGFGVCAMEQGEGAALASDRDCLGHLLRRLRAEAFHGGKAAVAGGGLEVVEGRDA